MQKFNVRNIRIKKKKIVYINNKESVALKMQQSQTVHVFSYNRVTRPLISLY